MPYQQRRNHTNLPPGRAHAPRKRGQLRAGRIVAAGGPCGAGREGSWGGGRHASLPGRPPFRACAVSSRSASQPRWRGSVRRAALSHGTCPSFRPRAGTGLAGALRVFALRRAARLSPVCSARRAQPLAPLPALCQRLVAQPSRPPPRLPSLPRAPHGPPAATRCVFFLARLRGVCASSAAKIPCPRLPAAGHTGPRHGKGRPAGRPQ